MNVNGNRRDWPARLGLDAGDVVDIAPGPEGNYGYLRFDREIHIPPVLGSRATNLAVGLGGYKGRALRAGDRLDFGDPGQAAPADLRVEAAGPIRVAGRSFLTGKVTTYTPDARAFFALAVGTSPLDAKIVQNNMAPLNEPAAVTGAARRLELPSVAVDVPAGQNLYLVVSPISDMFLSHGSRVPGVVQVSDVRLELPTV